MSAILAAPLLSASEKEWGLDAHISSNGINPSDIGYAQRVRERMHAAHGFDDLTVFHSGRTAPVGEVTLRSDDKMLKTDKGSAMLLLVGGSGPEQALGSHAPFASRGAITGSRIPAELAREGGSVAGRNSFHTKKGTVMVHPFDPKTVFFAKHAQHVVLIHFPIALFITAVGFDLVAQWTKRRGLADAAYYNLVVAAISTLPVFATGILAWQLQLEGQKLKGVLLLHVVLACVSTVMIWVVWSAHFRARRRAKTLPTYRLALEILGVGLIALTGHLGGFLSGVNLPG